MGLKRKKYYYKKQLNRKGRYGGVELELSHSNLEIHIVDCCEWKDFADYNTNPNELKYFVELKNYVISTANFILNNVPQKKIKPLNS